MNAEVLLALPTASPCCFRKRFPLCGILFRRQEYMKVCGKLAKSMGSMWEVS